MPVLFDNETMLSEWYIPFRTGIPGRFSLTLTHNNYAPMYIFDELMPLSTYRFVSAFFQIDSKGNMVYLLGTAADGLPSSVLSKVDLPSVRVNYIEDYSSYWILTFRSAPSQYVLSSSDQLNTQPTLYRASDAAFAVGSDVCGTGENVIYSGVFGTSSVYLHTNQGLVRGFFTGKNGEVKWELLLAKCISDVRFPAQGFNTRVKKCAKTVAFDAEGNMWAMIEESLQFRPLQASNFVAIHVESNSGYTGSGQKEEHSLHFRLGKFAIQGDLSSGHCCSLQ